MRKTIVIVIIFAASTAAWSQTTDSSSIIPAITPPVDSVFVVADTAKDVPVLPDYVIYCDSGIASWYGPAWKGRLTASGEYFDPDSMTAAHKWLPFGTIVRVTNLTNDSVAYVRITDRLPKSSSRSIDLTPTAAKRLGFYSKGLQKVKMETIGMIPVRRKTTSCGPGTFANSGSK
jgi:rare lipoprotein A (peptidoglycan hydrolase)